jgi:hypothetical protein
MSDLIKAVVLDKEINSVGPSGSLYYVDDIVKRYRLGKNGFRFTFVQELSIAKTIFDYEFYNSASNAMYSLLLFNPNMEEKNEGELKNFLDRAKTRVPIIMCSNRAEDYWETNKELVRWIDYDYYFPISLASIRESSGYFLELENVMKEIIKRNYK